MLLWLMCLPMGGIAVDQNWSIWELWEVCINFEYMWLNQAIIVTVLQPELFHADGILCSTPLIIFTWILLHWRKNSDVGLKQL